MKKRIKLFTIDRTTARQILKDIPHTAFFGCTFVKKDGSTRKMNCNKSISVGLKNKRKPIIYVYDRITVFDRNAENGKGGFRQVNISTLTEIRTNAKIYLVQ